MVAALLRVVYGGIQDARFICQKGQPSNTYFVKVFVRAGRFTTQLVRIDFDTLPSFGNTSVITLPRKGHLISRLYLVSQMPDISTQQLAAKQWCADQRPPKPFVGPAFSWTNSLGHALINTATLEIGGTRVEVLDGQLLEVMDEFYTPLEKVSSMDKLIQRNSTNFRPGYGAGRDTVTQAITPLPFWFSSGDAGAFLPIDALQADPVKLFLNFSPLNTLYTSTAQLDTSALTSTPAGGEAYFPLANSPFYYADAGGTDISGLSGFPGVNQKVKAVPGIRQGMAGDLAYLGSESYIMAEYIYLDRPEANRFRLADIQVPILQHYAFDPVDTVNAGTVNCYLRVPNPTRNLFFYAQRYESPYYNAPFMATRDLSDSLAGRPTPWWPNATQIGTRVYDEMVPAFTYSDSEPISAISLIYEGSVYRYNTASPSIFRSFIPGIEQRKTPWVNRYMYNLPFAFQSGFLAPSQHCGEANLDKIPAINLSLELAPYAGQAAGSKMPRYLIKVWAETYNIFRVYGGRGGMMFAY
jgi:hypothetical protein